MKMAILSSFSICFDVILLVMHLHAGFCLAFGGKKEATHYIKVDKFEACEDALDNPVVYQPAQIFRSDNEALINYNVTVKKQIGMDLEVLWVLEKCVSKESLNTCQQFYKIRNGRYCSFLQAKGEIWSGFIDCTTPRFECPFKKGTYYGKNCKVDLSLFKLFPIQNSYWRAKIITNDVRAKSQVSCTSVAGGMAKL